MLKSVLEKVRRVTTVLCLVATGTACSHIESSKDLPLPQDLRPYFGTCRGTDGLFSARAYQGQELYYSGEVEWVAAPQNGWQALLLNPGGLESAHIKFHALQKTLEVEDRQGHEVIQAQSAQIEVDDAGFLNYKSHGIGLLANEIPCILSGKLPLTWVENLKIIKRGEGQTFQLEARQARREITLDLPTSAGSGKDICANIKWSEYLGLASYSAKICYASGRRISINYNEGLFRITGRHLDG